MAFGITEYPNQFKRQDSFSLDKSSKYEKLSDAIEYAAHSAIAYNLQIIGVDETSSLYVLQPSNEEDTNYKLIPLDTFFINYLQYKIGTWSITDRIEDITSAFNIDIDYPIEVTHYRIYLNDNDISGQLPIGETFVTAPIIFKQSKNKITLVLERVKENVTQELLKVNAVTVYNNDFVTMGILTTYDTQY